jgi:tRNA-dihydrouridine synthase 1
MRARLGQAKTLDDYFAVISELKHLVLKDIEEQGEGDDVQGQADENGIRKYAYWRCQPYFRPKLPESDSNPEKRKAQSEADKKKHIDKKQKKQAAVDTN